jgi:hypothetical protein
LLPDQRQMVERFRLGQLGRFGHTLFELIPRQHCFDGGVRIAARFLRRDQRPANARIQPHLVVKRLALFLELLLMLVLGGAEKFDHNPVVQIDQLIDDGGHALDHQRYQGRVTSLVLEIAKIARCHLRAFPCHLQQSVLVDLAADPVRQSERLEYLQALNVCPHVAGIWPQWRLTQPHQPATIEIRRHIEQVVQSAQMARLQRLYQCPVNAPVGACLKEKALAGRWDRPELSRLLDQLRKGDVLVVWKLDRLSRSLKDVLTLMETVEKAGKGFFSLAEAVDTTLPAGRMMMQIAGSFAEFERAMLREHTSSGLLAARREGRIGGCRLKLTPTQQKEIVHLVDSSQKTAADYARLFNVHPSTVARLLGKR